MVVKNMKTEKGFRKLLVWQRAHQWVLLIYKLTEKFPKQEMFGLTSQMRRAAVSVAANIAQGSLAEVEYYPIVALDLKYITQAEHEDAEALGAETGFLLHRIPRPKIKPLNLWFFCCFWSMQWQLS